MPTPYKRNSLLCFALAIAFSWAFMFAKHDPALGAIVPFGDDPYDAVGSFAIFIALITAVIAMVRAFRPYQASPSAAQRLFLVRAQTAVVLVVLITLGSDMVAMARHAGLWMHSARRPELAALLGGLGLSALAVESLVLAAQRAREPAPLPWTRMAVVAAVAAAILGVYPERLIAGVTTHLLTVVLAALMLFATTRLLLVRIVPDDTLGAGTPQTHSRLGMSTSWGVAALIGVGFGASAFLGELSEGGGPQPIARLAALAAVFLGLAIAGVLIAFGFLGAPLGFGHDRRS